ncbi:MAG: methyl-accepting chemotaxis protein [Candidatus Tectimicrobiota bacterium]
MLQKLQQSIQMKLVLPIVLGALAVVGLSTISMFYIKKKNTELTGLTTARAVTDQVATVRTFYNDIVVPRARKAGVQIDFDFMTRDNTLPFPATLVKVLGEEIQKRHPGTSVRLYSRHPWPHRVATEQYDAFELEAITALEKDPKTPFYRLEEWHGRPSMRYAVADVMRASCVNCHNAHPQSPQTDTKEGDVRGVVEVIVPVDEVVTDLQAGTVRLAGITGGCLGLLTVVLVWLLRRSVIRPVQALAATNARLSQGDLTARALVQNQDEIGNLAMGFNGLLDRLVQLLKSTEEERDQTQAAVQKLLEEVSDVATGDLTVEAEVTTDMTGAIADSFNYMIYQLRTVIAHVQEAALHVSASANEIQTTAEHLAQGSTAQATQILDSSAALDEMATSIQQVSESAAVSARVAQQALGNAKQGTVAVQNTIEAMQHMRTQVQSTATRVRALGERSQEIVEIVQLIGDLADRTSVLALNASIEAALAGEAGQGFGVVAQEVERLAERAATATRQITGLVAAMQSETRDVVQAMEASSHEVVQGAQLAEQAGQALGAIESVSTQLAELIQSISLASKQQARGSENLSRAMGEIADVTQQVATGTKQAAVSINSLATLADNLRHSVSTFKVPAHNDERRSIA